MSYLKERIFSKVSKPELVYWWILRIFLLTPLIFNWESNHEGIVFQLAANFAATFMWEIMQLLPQKTMFAYVSPKFQNVTILFIVAGTIFGAFLDWYYTIWWWDSMLHVFGGAMMMFVGYELISAIQKRDQSIIPLNILILCAFGFSFFLGTVWELFEFFYDQFTLSDSQHWSYANNDGLRDLITTIPERFPIMDTMIDMTCNTFGTFVFTFILRRYPYNHKGKNDLNKKFGAND
ncbi:MAG: hypothetical protein LBH71_03335 [Oscillospiraceae bacterium]|jgi:hypothetical protein|nr:hypothetical protein [Oscillospiraceae bacterium]